MSYQAHRRKHHAGGSSYLLDDYPGAALAFSLRLLSSGYSGDCMRVREDGGDTEADIGFSGGVLDESAIASHCGANNGYVVTWYDQSGNGYDATSSLASREPQIYDGSAVVTDPDLGGASIKPTGTNQLVTPSFDFDGSTKRWATFAVSNFSAGNLFWVLSAYNTQSFTVAQSVINGGHTLFDGTWRYAGSHTQSLLIAKAWVRTGDTTLKFLQNDSQLGSDITIGDTNRAAAATGIFNYYNPVENQGTSYFAELIHYTTDQASNQSGISGNQMSYFGIS